MRDAALDAARDCDDLIAMLEASRHWDDLEGLSILEHGLQTASILRAQHPDDIELQVAGLVHDLGWMHRDRSGDWAPVPDATHDRDGATRLRPLLGHRIADLVAGHVAAKRYLVTVDPDYRDSLSPRSLETLGFQGELMHDTEVSEFEARADFGDLVALRRADDMAKVLGLAVDTLDAWRPVIERVVTG